MSEYMISSQMINTGAAQTALTSLHQAIKQSFSGSSNTGSNPKNNTTCNRYMGLGYSNTPDGIFYYYLDGHRLMRSTPAKLAAGRNEFGQLISARWCRQYFQGSRSAAANQILAQCKNGMAFSDMSFIDIHKHGRWLRKEANKKMEREALERKRLLSQKVEEMKLLLGEIGSPRKTCVV